MILVRIFIVASGVFLESMINSARNYRKLSLLSTFNFRFPPRSGIQTGRPMHFNSGFHDRQTLHSCSLSLSKSLMIHVQSLLKSAVIYSYQRNNKEEYIETIIKITDSLIVQLSSNSNFNSSNRKFFEVGSLLAKALVAYPIEKLELDPSIPLILSFYESRLKTNNAVFETIIQHHSDIAKNGLSSVKTDSLEKYANAAEAMGSKAWVAEANKWMQTFAISYFRRNGARKAFIQKWVNAGNNSVDYKSLPKDLLSSDISTSSKIRILDVGSCYNPIAKSQFAEAFDTTAIDLYPADDSVLQCNFLDLEVRGPTTNSSSSNSSSSSGSSSISTSAEIHVENVVMAPQSAASRRSSVLKWLPEASFDAVSMSLVLSYLPTPTERLEMIRKARQLLVPPGFNSQPHRAGILLIVEKVSIFGKEYESDGDIVGPNRRELLSQWKQAISGEGFELLFHRVNVGSGNRRYHAFAFATSDVPRNKSRSSNEVAMWIKQDFHVHDKDDDDEILENSSSSYHERESKTSGRQKEQYVSKQNVDEESSSVVKGNSGGSKIGGTKSPPLLPRRSTKGPVSCLPVGIVGGGLGGSALAVALQNQGIPFVLFEKVIVRHR